MSDYPRNPVTPTHIATSSRYMIGSTAGRAGAYAAGTSQVWTVNAAIFIPLCVPWLYNVRRIFWTNGGSPSGNSDIGIYSASGSRLWSSGSTACSGGGVPQYITPSPDILLHPGVNYYLAFAHDVAGASNITGSGSATWGRMWGLLQQTSGFPLPSQATFVAYGTLPVPLIGITNTDSGF